MNITFVNDEDKIIGYGSKHEAIQNGIIHRVVRILVFNSAGQLLIQKRAPNVDVPNKWDQSAAGHVDEGEEYLEAGLRELKEEVGIISETLKEIGKFYSEETDDNKTRKRFNMLYSTSSDNEIVMEKSEVSEVRWISVEDLNKIMKEKPEDFTQGFKQAFQFYIDSH